MGSAFIAVSILAPDDGALHIEECSMSESDVGGSTADNAGLYDATGKAISSGQKNAEKVEDLVRFAREQPVATAVGALVIGYILGKLT
jgi:hypothetical protein